MSALQSTTKTRIHLVRHYQFAVHRSVPVYLTEPLQLWSTVFKFLNSIANIFESGSRVTPWKGSDKSPLIPSCKLGQN